MLIRGLLVGEESRDANVGRRDILHRPSRFFLLVLRLLPPSDEAATDAISAGTTAHTDISQHLRRSSAETMARVLGLVEKAKQDVI